MELQVQSERKVKVLDGEGNVRSLGEIEKEVIEVALEHYRGRVSEAARRLKMSRSTLYRKINGFNLRPQEEASVSAPQPQAQPQPQLATHTREKIEAVVV